SRLRGKELGPRQHIFAVRRDLMDEPTYRTLLAVARVVLHTRNGTIFDQIERAEAAALQARDEFTPHDATTLPEDDTTQEVSAFHSEVMATDGQRHEYWSAFACCEGGGRNYVVRLSGRRVTPQPWINVIANEGFGFHVSAEGAAFTWSRNSRDYQIAPWSIDP